MRGEIIKLDIKGFFGFVFLKLDITGFFGFVSFFFLNWVSQAFT